MVIFKHPIFLPKAHNRKLEGKFPITTEIVDYFFQLLPCEGQLKHHTQAAQAPVSNLENLVTKAGNFVNSLYYSHFRHNPWQILKTTRNLANVCVLPEALRELFVDILTEFVPSNAVTIPVVTRLTTIMRFCNLLNRIRSEALKMQRVLIPSSWSPHRVVPAL